MGSFRAEVGGYPFNLSHGTKEHIWQMKFSWEVQNRGIDIHGSEQP